MKELTKLAREVFANHWVACTVYHPRGVAVGHKGYLPFIMVRMGRDESKRITWNILQQMLQEKQAAKRPDWLQK